MLSSPCVGLYSVIPPPAEILPVVKIVDEPVAAPGVNVPACNLEDTVTNLSSVTDNEAEAFAFCTSKAVVDEVVPDPLTCS